MSSFTQPSLQISLPRPHFPLTLFVPIKRHCDVFIWFQDIDIRSVVPVDVTKYNATGGGSYLIVFHIEQSNEACWRYIDRYREVAHDRLMHDYFNDSYVYPPLYLCRRYHMRRNLFLHILERLGEHSSYSTLRTEVVNDNGSPPHQKCTTALCMLAYDSVADSIDEYIKMEKKFHLMVSQTFILRCF